MSDTIRNRGSSSSKRQINHYSAIDTVHCIARSTVQGRQTDIAFLDFSKAFDSVLHSHLIRKLDHSGMKGPLLQWFTSYLTDRMQCVVIDGKHSGWLSVTSGVPQGSLLGPAFFVSCINDIPRDLSHSSSLALFVDDVKCFHTTRTVSDCESLQSDILTI